jgi:hypothetical protein
MEWLPWVFPLIGVVVVVGGIRSLRAASRFQRSARQAPATVTELRWEWTSGGSNSSSSRVAYPVVRFALPDGRLVETQTSFGSNPPPAREGDQVTVLYDPDDPTSARLPGFFKSGHFSGVMAIVLGCFFIVLGSLIGSAFLLLPGS